MERDENKAPGAQTFDSCAMAATPQHSSWEHDSASACTTFDGGITPEQVAQMKAKHRKAFRIDIVDGEDTHVGYFKRPDFDTIKAVTKVSKVDEVEAGKIMFDKCWLGGSEELRNDAVLFMAVQGQLGKVLNSCMGSLKNL